MAAALAAVVGGVAGSLSDIFPTGELLKLKLEDGFSVKACFRADGGGGERVSVTVVYTDPDSYPSSSALLMAEGPGAERVERLSEQFCDRAPLTSVLCKVSDALGVVYIEDDLRRHEARGRSSAGGAAAAAAARPAVAEAAPPSVANNTAAAGAGGGDESGDGDDFVVDPMSEGEDNEGGGQSNAAAAAGSSEPGSDDGDEGGGGSESGQSSSGDEQMEEQSSDDEDRDMLVECGVRQGKWERHEAELEKASQSTALSMEQAAASKNQIFTAAEGFKMLSNELLAIIRRQDPTLFADSVGDDIYKWDVWLSSFDRDSQLGKDMEAVSRRCAYSTIQLRITFMRGLHPFYPPRLEVIRPHLASPMLGALCSHPMLRLANWDPWRKTEEVVGAIKAFLEAHGRVDVDHPLNADPDSAYSPLETALGRLEALTDVKSVASTRHAELYAARDEYSRNEASLEALQQVGKKLRLDPSGAPGATGSADDGGGAAAAGGAGAGADGAAAAGAAGAAGGAAAGGDGKAQTYWARGTGYGFGSSSKATWDPKQAEAAQRAQDEQQQEVLAALLDALISALGGTIAATDSSAAAAAKGPAAAGDAAAQAAVAAVRDSVLLPFLWHHLCSAAFTEMTSRSAFYTTLLRIARELCRPASCGLLLSAAATGGGGGAVGAAVRGMQRAAQHYATAIQKTVLPPGATLSDAGASGSSGAGGSSSAGGSGGVALTVTSRASLAAEAALREARAGLAMADLVSDIAQRLSDLEAAGHGQLQQGTAGAAAQQGGAAGQHGAGGSAAGTAGGQQQQGGGDSPEPAPRRRVTRASSAAQRQQQQQAAAAAAAGTSQGQRQGQQQEEEDYVVTLKPMQVDYHPAVCTSHLHLKHAQNEAAPLKTRAARVAKEIAGLERLLPLTESSGVFVRVDEANTFLWRALIVGPEDTPYSGGCFIFDIYFPGTYPQVPPLVLLRTTGGGRFRFNPNLYNCGKVCLSLLGTWSGALGESWNADVSTTFQVLISIQSLILVDEPYFNEPGYERTMNSDSGKAQSRAYNRPIREETIKLAMLDLLKHPPAEWEGVIEAHFRIRAASILSTVDKWISEAGREGENGHKSRLTDLRRQLADEFAKLRR